jgi:hypothetical protein
MTTKKKEHSEKVPPEIAFAFRHGKLAYQRHKAWPDGAAASDECLKIYLLCGMLIYHPDDARKMWAEYRAELLRRPDIKSWWAFSEYEKRSKTQCVDSNGE